MSLTPLIIRLEHQGSVQTYAFDASPVRIGRNPLNDLPIDQSFVSQWHAIVRFDAKGTRYFDLGSTNGTTIDGQRAEKNVPIDVDERNDVKIGALKLGIARGPIPADAVGGRPFASFAQKGGAEQIKKTIMLGHDFATTSQHAVQTTKKLYNAVNDQRPLYEAWRASWSTLHGSMMTALDSVGAEHRGLTLGALLQAFPELANEPQFADDARSNNVPLAGGSVNSAAAANELVASLAKHYAPSTQAPASPAQIEKFLDRVANLLDAYTRAYVELRKGYQQFGHEMAVGHGGSSSPVERARDTADVLAYLMDWTTDGTPRVRELVSSFADIMIHQVALLNGMMEGVRSLLRQLAPEDIAKEADAKAGFFQRLFPGGNRFAHFAARYRAMTEEDRSLSSAVFGTDFARAYALASGERFDEQAQRLLPRPRTERTDQIAQQPDMRK